MQKLKMACHISCKRHIFKLSGENLLFYNIGGALNFTNSWYVTQNYITENMIGSPCEWKNFIYQLDFYKEKKSDVSTIEFQFFFLSWKLVLTNNNSTWFLQYTFFIGSFLSCLPIKTVWENTLLNHLVKNTVFAGFWQIVSQNSLTVKKEHIKTMLNNLFFGV